MRKEGIAETAARALRHEKSYPQVSKPTYFWLFLVFDVGGELCDSPEFLSSRLTHNLPNGWIFFLTS
jgi:hypothetical protein